MTEQIRVSQIALWDGNYNEGDIGAIAMSIRTFGFAGALRVWKNDEDEWVCIGGNHTLQALWGIKADGPRGTEDQWPPAHVDLDDDGMWLVDCVDMSHLDWDAAVAYAIADNRLAQLASENKNKLAEYLASLAQHEDGRLFEATGYDGADLDRMLRKNAEQKKTEGEFKISPELFERHDYIVLYFDNELDWQVAKELFELETVICAPVGSKSVEQKGLGRVVPGRWLLERVDQWQGRVTAEGEGEGDDD